MTQQEFEKIRLNVYKYWFDADVDEIFVIAKNEDNPGIEAYQYCRYYKYIDKFGDRDLIVRVTKFLARFYPLAKISLITSSEYNTISESNCVVLGAPRNNANYIANEFMRVDIIRNRVLYPPITPSNRKENAIDDVAYMKRKSEVCPKDCERFYTYCNSRSICINKEIVPAKLTTFVQPFQKMYYKERSMLEEMSRRDSENFQVNVEDEVSYIHNSPELDHGLMVCMKNTKASRKNARVVLLNGIFTFGANGVLSSFDGSNARIALANYELLGECLQQNRDFLLHSPFVVNDDNQLDAVKLPKGKLIARDCIFSLERSEGSRLPEKFKINNENEFENFLVRCYTESDVAIEDIYVAGDFFSNQLKSISVDDLNSKIYALAFKVRVKFHRNCHENLKLFDGILKNSLIEQYNKLK